MPSCLVTGAAGFIGSHLCERLVGEGYAVRGIDSFSAYYDRGLKERNLTDLLREPRFELVERDLLEADLEKVLGGIDLVFHEAAQAGVRASWGEHFGSYVRANIDATQKLLEACRLVRPRIVVAASSSSVYGDAADLPLSEASLPRPISPYGATKLAAEALCWLYFRNTGLPVVSLRYFTVYGPRQRPDMAFHRFIRAHLDGKPITVYGDGVQSRDFTYVSDAVEANLLAAKRETAGEIYNVGGGSRVTLNEVVRLLEELTGQPVKRIDKDTEAGDVRHTEADTRKAKRDLGFAPRVAIREGLGRQLEWHRELR